MRLFLVVVLFLSVLLASAHAQQDADSRYINIYGEIQQADTYLSNGQSKDALNSYKDAQLQLLKFQEIYPDWEKDIINYRLNDLAGKISALQAQLPPATSSPAPNASANNNSITSHYTTAVAPTNSAPAPAPVNNPANDLQMKVLQTQLQSLKDENTKLAAKLQEALSTQPQMVDASALAAANDKIRALMKENDLLKASAKTTSKPASGDEISQLRLQLAAAEKQLADEHARAQKLSDENATLQLALATANEQNKNALDNIRDEDDRLKSQLDSMKAAAQQASADSILAATESAQKLTTAKDKITALESSVILATLEKTALEDRLKRLSSVMMQTNTNYQASIQGLSQQRDDLAKNITVISEKNAVTNTEVVSNSPPPVETPAVPTPVKRPTITETVSNNSPEPTTNPPVETSPAVEPTPTPAVSTNSPAPVAQSAPATPAVPTNSPTPVAQSPAPQPQPIAKPAALTDAQKKEIEALISDAQKHFTNNEFAAADADYRQILQKGGTNSRMVGDLAVVEMQEGKLADAETHIKAAIAANPDDAFDVSTLGKIQFTRGDYTGAMDTLAKAAKMDPSDPETQNYLGVAYSHQGLRKQAESAFLKAIEINPDYGDAHNNLAALYATQNPPLPQLARWHYQKALETGLPHNPELEKLLAQKGAPVSSPSQ